MNPAKLRHKLGIFPYYDYTKEERLEIFNILNDNTFTSFIVDCTNVDDTEVWNYKLQYNNMKIKIVPNKNIKNIWKTDILANIYNDKAMIAAKFNYYKYNSISPLNAWNNDKIVSKLINIINNKGQEFTNNNIRDAMYEYNLSIKTGRIKEISSMKATWMIGIISYIFDNNTKGKKWLDISAGWGDRLISSIVLGMEYTGYDPNVNLIEGHNNILKELSNDNMKREVIVEPFEDSNLPSNYFDIVLSSPPYSTLEIYTDDNTQSIIRYPKIQNWINNFLLVSLDKSLLSLKVGGYLAINIANVSKVNIIRQMFNHLKYRTEYMGVMCIPTASNRKTDIYKNVWVWKKV